jgi:mono/diheme cytochrome c family protein
MGAGVRAIWIGVVLGLATASQAGAAEARLRFLRDAAAVRTLTLAELRQRCETQRVQVPSDPYYGVSKRFFALPLACVLEAGFGAAPEALAGESFFLRARDGYVKPAVGGRLLQPTAFLAFADADLTDADASPFVAHWQPIDRRQVDPGPFYLVWSGPAQQDAHRYPWPYQLAAVEIAPFASEYPHAVPEDAAPGSPARAGFEIFRSDCISCHSVNGEGGKVGPDLNVPMSIVEYRPPEQIKAFVRNPRRFRYTSMPANPQLDDADLDALVAYFAYMSQHKHDPGAGDRP